MNVPSFLLPTNQETPSFRRDFFPVTFRKLQIMFSISVDLLVFPHLNGPELLPFASDKKKFYAEIFLENSNLDDFLYASPSITNY